MEGKIDRCQHCGEDKTDCYYGYISMTLPIPEAEALIEKWNIIDAYKRYESEWALENPPFAGPYTDTCLTQEEFINKIKNEDEFKKKWYNKKWYNNLEREDLTDDEVKELDGISMYDQLLNTVGRGVQCNDCAKKEDELYKIYYPTNN